MTNASCELSHVILLSNQVPFYYMSNKTLINQEMKYQHEKSVKNKGYTAAATAPVSLSDMVTSF